MYFPLGWPKRLKSNKGKSHNINHIVSSCDRLLFAVVSSKSLNIWYSKPCVQIVTLKLNHKLLAEVGNFLRGEWKPDSSLVAIMTENNCIVFIKVEVDNTVPNHHCLYVMQEGKVPLSPKININGILDSDSVPAIKLTYVAHVRMQSSISCFLSVKDELVVATVDGCLNRLRWSGNKNEKATLHLKDIPVSTDLQQFRASRISHNDSHVVEMEYSPTLGGYSMVLSSGRALFVIPPSNRGEQTSAHGVWAQDVNSAASVAVNHRYRLIAFGCQSGDGVVYHLDEAVGALEVSHKLVISSKEFPDAGIIAGSVTCMKWTPDGTALALSWKNGGLSLWSVFGSLLLCTLGGEYSISDNGSLFPPPIISMEWGLEGYHLWMVTLTCDGNSDLDLAGHDSKEGSFSDEFDRKLKSDENCEDNKVKEEKLEQVSATELIQFQFLKSALTVNPCMGNHEHVFLQGEDKLYMSTGDTMSRGHSHYHAGGSSSAGHGYIGNKQWQVIPISHSYLASNWPIRYASVDKAGQCVAVAGKTGFAHYALFNRKWKLFGNETQERDMVVSGGITWWKDFICLACFNIQGQRDEIRCYPRACKLDNTFAQVFRLRSQVLLLNTFRDLLIVFCADSHVVMFSLERKNTQQNPSVLISMVQEISLTSFIPHPLCVTGLTLTSLMSDSVNAKLHPSAKEAESMLVNVSGKLLMFQRDRTGPQIKDEKNKHRPVPFCNPTVVATSVENLWTTTRANVGKIQLMEAMWLGCGSHGMKVWLPLFPRDEGKAHNFMSRRIMLPFRVDIYPLAVLFEDAVILGAACDVVSYTLSSSVKNYSEMPFCTLERTSQIYLHHILRQLLRRNLGVNALDLARSCKELTYFPHVLELLLHEVLEAEATSKEPIPDPLLPRVVAFIQEFPEFLQTIVHCARKTEVALWPYLFSTVGNPKDLFEECLMLGNLETAATYLIILQNLEKPIVSRQHATILLDSALDKGYWELCRDLVRFLKAIDSTEPVESMTNSRLSGTATHSAFPTSPPMSPSSHAGYSYSNVSNVGRMRTSSIVEPREVKLVQKEKAKHTVSDSLISAGKRPTAKQKQTEPTAEQVYIDMILCRHARKLLASNNIRTLGYFSANMEDFQFVAWLKRERVRAGKMEDFVSALREIHTQFEWPMPVLSAQALQQLKKSLAASSSSLSSSVLDDDFLSPSVESEPMTSHTLTSSMMSPTLGPQLTEQSVAQVVSDEIILKPQNLRTDESSLATIEISDSSSLLGDYEVVNDSILANDVQLNIDLEGISQEVASSRGPEQAHLELEYLLHIMLEAGCLEWALILAIVLRDSMAVSRVVTTASCTETPLDMVARMREGLSYLELWADTECLGYKSFFHQIRGEAQRLGKLLEVPTTPSLSLDVSSSSNDTPSVEEGNLSPCVQAIRPEVDALVNQQEGSAHYKRSDCAIS
ncbi:guanine nucleotide exchange factor subunit RIC1-like isoform X4 [Physella acuta]|uniref:guanine nucleotide exchange factor subunit RIC1-like isoform X4 n=1 Tax=Physella acuta TaxID=109671 RepID=UPI0027DC99B3|nr:guanine nucleotide exchange factor subunit RIC1-like isoform X4 [Physella acuta]